MLVFFIWDDETIGYSGCIILDTKAIGYLVSYQIGFQQDINARQEKNKRGHKSKEVFG